MSWIIVDRRTGKPIIELFDKRNVARINTTFYEVFTAYAWLVKFNRELKEAQP